MNKPTEKFYIVAERDNPQLGTYLSKVLVGTKKVNKTCISCRYEHLGDYETKLFSICENTIDGIHFCLSRERCVYGGMSYYGFSDAEKAKAYLDAHWSKSHNYAECIKKLCIAES